MKRAGISRDELLDNRHLLPGVRFAVDAYVNFARSQPWPIAIASSLTELFAPDLMTARLAAFEKFYRWIDPRGLDYFRRRVTQARRDSDEALAITLEYCNTPELQREAVRALEFKCDVLWSMLDAIHHGYFKEGRSLVRPAGISAVGRPPLLVKDALPQQFPIWLGRAWRKAFGYKSILPRVKACCFIPKVLSN